MFSVQKDLETHFVCIHYKAGYNMTQAPQTTSPYVNESIQLKWKVTEGFSEASPSQAESQKPSSPPAGFCEHQPKNALRHKTQHFEPMEQKSKIYTNNFWTNITFLFFFYKNVRLYTT